MRSQVASEAVQAILRCRLRDDPTACVRVFYPFGTETELGVRIMRELPGATIEGGPVRQRLYVVSDAGEMTFDANQIERVRRFIASKFHGLAVERCARPHPLFP